MLQRSTEGEPEYGVQTVIREERDRGVGSEVSGQRIKLDARRAGHPYCEPGSDMSSWTPLTQVGTFEQSNCLPPLQDSTGIPEK